MLFIYVLLQLIIYLSILSNKSSELKSNMFWLPNPFNRESLYCGYYG